MTIKELRDNIDKIDDDNLWNLSYDLFYYGNARIYDFNETLEMLDITDYIPIPYEVCEENDNYKQKVRNK